MLSSSMAKLRPAKRPAYRRRRATVEQLSLLALTEPESCTTVWDLLDEEQRAEIVAMLARLMARTVARTEEEKEEEEGVDD